MKLSIKIISSPIKTKKDGRFFIKHLVNTRNCFYFPDDPDNIYTGSLDKKTFNKQEVKLLRERIDELYSLTWGKYSCPIGYMTELEKKHKDSIFN